MSTIERQPDPRQARRARVMLYASGIFVALTVAAMLVYPGGAVFNLGSDHYLFFQNFFSDLGATSTPSGRANLVSHVLFTIALGAVGLALIQFAPAWKAIAGLRGKGSIAGVTAQYLAAIAGLGFIGIAATPWNHLLDAHNAFVRAAFGFLLLYILCLVILQVRNGWPFAYTAIDIGYLLLLLAYVVILFAGPRLDTQSGLEFQVAAQKVIVYASILNLALQSVGILLASRPRTPSSA